jgi:hypothetical protein
MYTTDRLIAARAEREKKEALAIENALEYQKALNGVASTPNGKLFIKTLIKACGVFDPDKEGSDAAALIRQSERRNVYLKFLRPYLEPQFKQELEN